MHDYHSILPRFCIWARADCMHNRKKLACYISQYTNHHLLHRPPTSNCSTVPEEGGSIPVPEEAPSSSMRTSPPRGASPSPSHRAHLMMDVSSNGIQVWQIWWLQLLWIWLQIIIIWLQIIWIIWIQIQIWLLLLLIWAINCYRWLLICYHLWR